MLLRAPGLRDQLYLAQARPLEDACHASQWLELGLTLQTLSDSYHSRHCSGLAPWGSPRFINTAKTKTEPLNQVRKCEQVPHGTTGPQKCLLAPWWLVRTVDSQLTRTPRTPIRTRSALTLGIYGLI